jgi:hypothetical protein
VDPTHHNALLSKKIKKEHKGSTKKIKKMPLQSFQKPENSLPANRLIKASQAWSRLVKITGWSMVCFWASFLDEIIAQR